MTRDVIAAVGLLIGIGTGVGPCVGQGEQRPPDRGRVVAWIAPTAGGALLNTARQLAM